MAKKLFSTLPPNENEKFILYLRAMCAMERCLAVGLVYQDVDFRNLVYSPDTLQVRIIDIEPSQHPTKPQDVWVLM